MEPLPDPQARVATQRLREGDRGRGRRGRGQRDRGRGEELHPDLDLSL